MALLKCLQPDREQSLPPEVASKSTDCLTIQVSTADYREQLHDKIDVVEDVDVSSKIYRGYGVIIATDNELDNEPVDACSYIFNCHDSEQIQVIQDRGNHLECERIVLCNATKESIDSLILLLNAIKRDL